MDGTVFERLESLRDVSLESCSDDELISYWQQLEAMSRQLAVVDHAVIAQVTSRHLDHRYAATSVPVLARQVLRIPAVEARARVAAAEAAGPRTSLTGEVLPPVFEQVAAAQAEGAISPVHARMIVRCIDRLPGVVQEVDGEQIEGFLVEQATTFDPDTFAKIVRRLVETIDPDGVLHDAEYRYRRRDLRLHVRPDGSARLEAELTAEAAEHVRVILDALAKPCPAVDGAPDTRTAGQRRHDALLTAMLMTERAQLLPNAGGITTTTTTTTTIILTATASDWTNAAGMVTTGHGVSIATEDAKQWAGDARIIAVVFDGAKAVARYSTSQRIFTECQRLAMIARDGGCSFPGCDAAPQQCQSHHVIDWADGGPTSIDNGALLCAYHHREFSRMGWSGLLINGRPHWKPPTWIDRDQVPIRNLTHHPEEELTLC